MTTRDNPQPQGIPVEERDVIRWSKRGGLSYGKPSKFDVVRGDHNERLKKMDNSVHYGHMIMF